MKTRASLPSSIFHGPIGYSKILNFPASAIRYVLRIFLSKKSGTVYSRRLAFGLKWDFLNFRHLYR
ncbi:hypothetical protein LEP1GSC120_0099 [Leptospira santarosai str. 200702252]|uniref:Uncharacterized protein n=2 Tax=Leptospira santarosai TaxID=28183 RepID=A0AB73N493_9LEPT|nr:hypothetical protein LEP1GSC163_2327 [Leptospira santarosai str. CBC379]EMO45310.1 hypothetical protein LEP1GSC187_0822 [Leptospira santarosai str. ZUN179]EMO83859.1 hypothetical protein LEP1GSC070_0647 [Leptospira santarosai str. AIM]EMO97585.1 hypothetical protein LEP1GSC120_0099 [Leptospira santarosai str. 200702252]EPG84115.1 hypothetical protein LEP1GSC048_0836 [Leptospira santarosai serovar Shermani str. 1342KT]OLY64930.1 hypothetical protein BWD11_06940 [Leptospira santarosai serovar